MRILKNIGNLFLRVCLSYLATMLITGIIVWFSLIFRDTGFSDWGNILLAGLFIFFTAHQLGFFYATNLKIPTRLLLLISLCIISISLSWVLYLMGIGMNTVITTLDLGNNRMRPFILILLFATTLWFIIFSLWFIVTAEGGEEALCRGLGWTLPPAPEKPKPVER
jgi:hypothetical protein